MTPFDCLIRAVTWRWRLQSDQCSWNALGRVTRVCRLNRGGFGGGDRAQVAPVFIRYDLRRSVRPGRAENLPGAYCTR